MNIYEKNIATINKSIKYNGTFLSDLLNMEDKDGILNIESINAKDGNKALVVEAYGKIYRLNSSFKPVEEAKRWVEQFEFKNIGIVISLFGFGNGIIPRELLKKMKDDEKLIIYEPSKEIFLHIIHNYDITDILEDSRVDVIVDKLNKNGFSRIFGSYINWQNLNSQLQCVHPKYDEIFTESKQMFSNMIEEINLKVVANANTDIHFGKLLTNCMIKNIKFITSSNSIIDLVELFPENMPAIIVSAGPSLDGNIEELKEAKGKAIIIAVDKALQHLVNRNIIPDFTITIDSFKLPTYYNDERLTKVPIMLETASNYEIINKHEGKKFFFAHHKQLISLYKELGNEIPLIVTGGSVSTSALAVCAFIGFKKIILVGQDLAYKAGNTHVGGIKDLSYINFLNMTVKDIYGNPIETRADWYYYLQWMNEAVEVLKTKGVEVIDATEGGAKINGTNIMALKEAINLYGIESIDTNKIIDEIKIRSDGNDINKIYEYINKSIDELNIIKKSSEGAIELCNKLIKEYEKIDDESYLSSSYNNELNKLNKKIEKLSVNNLLNEYISSFNIEQLSDIYLMNDDEKNNKIKTYKTAINFYKANIKGADDIKIMLNETILSV